MDFQGASSGRMAALALCGVALLLAGCGQFFPPQTSTGTGTGTSSGDYLYVGNLETNNLGIAAFSFANSTLSAVSGSPFSAVAAPVTLAVTPNDDYLYVGGGDSEAVAEYPIDSDGALGSGTVMLNYSPAALAVDTTGNWLLGVDSVTGEVYAFGIDTSTGGLTEPLSSSLAYLTDCDPLTDMAGLAPGLVVSSSDNYVYASCGTAGVYVLSFDSSTGALTYEGRVTPATANGADSGLAIATVDSSSYLLAAETVTNGVRVFSINSSGGLTQVSGSPFATGTGPDAVLVDSTDSYVYVANRTAGTISGFTLGSGGALTAISGSPFATGALPVGLVEDKSDTYIAAICYGGNADLETYTIGSSPAGALVSFKNSATGSDPTAASSVAATH